MGLYGGGGGYKGPPDYTKQKGEIRTATEARYAQQANEWNAAASAFNTGMSGYRNQLYDLGDQIGGLDITDTGFDDLKESLSGLSRNIRDAYVGQDFTSAASRALGDYDPNATYYNKDGSVWEADPDAMKDVWRTEKVYAMPSDPGGGWKEVEGKDGPIAWQREVADKTGRSAAEQFDAARSGLYSDLGGESMTSRLEKPLFDSAVGSEYGTVGITNIPRLTNADTGLQNNLLAEARSLESQLDRLTRDRAAEERRVGAFRQSLLGGLAPLEARFEDLTIADAGQMGSLGEQVRRMRGEARGFSSPLLDQLAPHRFRGVNRRLDTLETGLSGLADQRAAEEKRIADYESGLYSKADAFADRLDGLTIADLDGIEALQGDVRGVMQDAGRFSSLLDFNFSDELGTYGVGGVTGGINQLLREREAEEGRVSGLRNSIGDYRRSTEDAISSIESDIDRFGIRDLTGFDNAASQIDRLERARARFRDRDFSSPLVEGSLLDAELGDFGDAMDGRITSARHQLAALRGAREDEEQRIASFEADLYNLSDQVRSRLGGLTIADIDQMEDARAQIEDRMRQAGRFSSELGYDFSDELGTNGLGGVGRQLETMFRDRALEEGRIADAERSFLDQGRSLRDLAGGLSIYDRSGIDYASGALSDLRSDISGFESPLAFDFSGAGDLDAVQGDIDAVLAERTGRLDEIAAAGGSALAGFDDIPLYDEDAIRDVRSALNDQLGDLGMFTGGRVDDIRSGLEGQMGTVDDRLTALSDKRAELAEQMKTLQSRIEEGTYRRADDLTGDTGDVEAMRDQIELYNAKQAMAALEAAERRLQSETGRIERDAETVEKRRNAAQDAMRAALGPDGVPQFQGDFDQLDPISLEDYLRIIAESEDDERMRISSPGTFSRLMGR